MILNSEDRSVRIRPFSVAQLELANTEYARVEERTQKGERIEAVLVSAGPIAALRRAYPNYFLDTNGFVQSMEGVIAQAK